MLMLPSTFSFSAPITSFPVAGPTNSASTRPRNHFNLGRQIKCCCSSHNLKDHRTQHDQMLHCDDNLRRRLLLFISLSVSLFPSLSSSAKTKVKNPYDERRLLEQNKRRQRENNAPEDFPNFIREGFEVKVVTTEKYIKCDSGLIYRDFEVGKGDCPKAGQQVTFNYVGYNESGRRIDSTYLQGAPARIRMGTNALVPGFEEGIKDMKAGGRRRIIIPPELGPPVGPSTFSVQNNLKFLMWNWSAFRTVKGGQSGSTLILYVNNNATLTVCLTCSQGKSQV